MFRLFTTKEFDNNFNRLDESEKIIARKILHQIRQIGKDVGKPLKVPYFREKRFGGKRLYFLAYENSIIILALAISDKKTQQGTIDKVLSNLDDYKKFIYEKLEDL